MARTKRRKSYIPSWVTSEWEDFYHQECVSISDRKVLIEKSKLKQLNWWHEDKGPTWNVRSPKWLRKYHESQFRANWRRQISLRLKYPDFEMQSRRKASLWRWY